MKKITPSILARVAMTLLLAALSSTGAWAEDVVVIGTANTAHTAPIMGDANYALSQEVYTADEINHAAGKVGAIAFNTQKGGLTRQLDIYITHSDETSVGILRAVTANDLYFSGEVYFENGAWTEILLDKPFNYDGKSGILITIDDNTGVSYGWGSLKNYIFYSSGCCFAYDDNKNFDPTNPSTDGISISPTSVSWKNQLQITFEENPRPSNLVVAEVSDKSALIQCSLRGNATAWNLRYRKVAKEGEQEQRWVAYNDLTTRSKKIEDLTPSTQYEVQVQGVFAGDKTSDWSKSKTFFTNCCPDDQMSEMIYSARGFSSCESAFQIVDAETGIEMAYVKLNSNAPINGRLSLGCDRTYLVNWISNKLWPGSDSQCSFSLSFLPNDKFYALNYGEAPEAENGEEGKSFELTKFVMDCTAYDFAKPTSLEVSDETYQGGKVSWKSDDAKQWQVSVSTDPKAKFEDGIVITTDKNPLTLNGLNPETEYSVSVRAVETKTDADGKEQVIAQSRPTEPVSLTTEPEKATPDPVDIAIKSSKKATIQLNAAKGTETKYNILIGKLSDNRTAVDMSKVVVLDLDGIDNPSYDDVQMIPEEKRIYSYGSRNKEFDHAVFIPLKSFEQLALEMLQMKTGEQPEPYSVGWISKKDLGDEPQKVPFSTLKNKLKKKYRISPKTLKKLKKTYQKKGFIPKSVLKRLKKRTRAGEDEENEEGYLWIRHNESAGGEMVIYNMEIVAAEDAEPWYEIQLREGEMEYTFNEFEPESTYMVMVEPVYDDGTTGPESPVTAFTSLSEQEDPLPSEFSIGKDGKKVSFARGNLRYNAMQEKFSIAPAQYDIIGEENAKTNASGKLYPADYRDLFCWSVENNDYGTYYAYNYADESMALPYFEGEFAEWGEIPSLTETLGEGWRTLTKDEWKYILEGRENAAQLRSFATVAGVKGLVILPDEWTAPDGVMLSDNMTAEQWATIEQTGVVFLPAAGQFVKGRSLEKIGEEGFYWSSSPSDVKSADSQYEAYAMSFSDKDVKSATIISRRVGSAVRLVKKAIDSKQLAAFNDYKEEKKKECDEMAMPEIDNDTCRELINNAKNDIDNKSFDEEKTLDENKADVDKIVSQLTIALSLERANMQTEADKNDLEKYKEEKKKECDEMAMPEIDDDHCRELIDKAKKDIDDKSYDEEKTLDENKADVDKIVQQLAIELSLYRANMGIEFISLKDARGGKWYDLQGRKLQGAPTRKGVYVRNNMTIVVK